MSFDSFSDFLAMGKHAPYVWSCYGLALLVLLANIWRPLQMKATMIRLRRRALAMEATRADSAEGARAEEQL